MVTIAVVLLCCCIQNATTTIGASWSVKTSGPGVMTPPFVVACRALHNCRGGDGGNNEYDEKDGGQRNHPSHLLETKSTESSNPLSSFPSLLTALFRWHDDVKADAATESNNEEFLSGSYDNNYDDSNTIKQQQQQNRGGFQATMIEPTTSTKTTPRFLPWFSFNSSDTTTTTRTSSFRQYLERFWWNNAWLDPIPNEEMMLEDMAEDHDLHHEDHDIVIVLQTEDDEENSVNDQKRKDPVIAELIPTTRKDYIDHGTTSATPTTNETTTTTLVVADPILAKKQKDYLDEKAAAATTEATTTGADTTTTKSVDSSSVVAEFLDDVESGSEKQRATAMSTTTTHSSSGIWVLIDAFGTAGYTVIYPSSLWRPSRALRPFRKAMAGATGLHGILSGKNRLLSWVERAEREEAMYQQKQDSVAFLTQEEQAKLAQKQEKRLEAIAKAREHVARVEAEKERRTFLKQQSRRRPFWIREEQGKDSTQLRNNNRRRRNQRKRQDVEEDFEEEEKQRQERILRYERLMKLDQLLQQGTNRMAELAAEKDLLQNMLNPFFNYSTTYDELEYSRRRRRQQQQKQPQQPNRELTLFERQDQLQQHTSSIHNDTAASKSNSTLGGANTDKFFVLNREHQIHDNYDYNNDEGKYGNIAPRKEFSFPHDDLVDEYLEMLFASGRLVRLNNTDLWKTSGHVTTDGNFDDDEIDEEDEWLQPATEPKEKRRRQPAGNQKNKKQTSSSYYHVPGGISSEYAGSRWLRYGLGEKISLAVEMVAYKAVCANVMGILAKSLAALHGINVMGHADIFIKAEQVPVLPLLDMGSVSKNYATLAFQNAMSKKSKKRQRGVKPPLNDSVQRQAVIETLLSQCQVATPLLKLFPLVWQRALIGNMISLITSVLQDFLEGVEFQILGHRLELVFKPITEQDMIKRLDESFSSSSSSSVRNAMYLDPARSHAAFEAAVAATTADLARGLKFLDKWHERVLGGDSIRTQIAALIARVVLSMVDDILSQARLDLWSTKTSGPKLVAGLYYRQPPPPPSSNTTAFQ